MLEGRGLTSTPGITRNGFILEALSEEAFTSAAAGTRLEILTAAIGEATPALRILLSGDASLRISSPTVFGTTASAPANASTGLELNSTTLAFLPSRLTTAQRDALTPADGMVIYNSTLAVHQVYQAGAWVSMGNVTGTGVANRLAYWTGPQTIDDDADLLWDPTTNIMVVMGQIQVPFNTPPQILVSAVGNSANVRQVSVSNTFVHFAGFVGQRARDAGAGVPGALNSGDVVYQIISQAHNGTSYGTVGTVTVAATENHGAAARGVQMIFQTIANGSTTLTTRASFNSDGNLAFGTAGVNRNRKTFSNAAYTVLVTDDYIAQVGTMSATRAVTLPTAASAGAGHVLTIKDESGTVGVVNTITFTLSGGDTTDAIAIAIANGSRTLISNGSNAWKLIAST